MMRRRAGRSAHGLPAAVLVLFALLSPAAGADPGPDHHPTVASTDAKRWHEFSQTYCIACHGPEKKKGGLRLDQVTPEVITDETYGMWKHVLQQLDQGEMPPEDAKRKPAAPDVAAIRLLIGAQLRQAEKSGRLTRAEVPLKRLTQVQYRNTMRDLLGIDTRLADPTRGFPDDRGGADFDVVGDGLLMTDSLMEHYLRASSQMIDAVTVNGPQPERVVRQYIDTTNRHRLEGGIIGDSIGHEIYRHYDIERGYWTTPQECGHVRIIGDTPFTVAGFYRLSFKVESLWRERSEVTKKLRHYSPKRPHQLAIRLLSPARTFPEVEHTIAIHDLPDHQVVDIAHEVWVPKDWRLQLYFENGPACPLWVLHQELSDWREIPTPPGATEEERAAIRKRNQAAEPTTPQSKEYLRSAVSPRIRLHKMVIDGPFYPSWPPAFHTALYRSGDAKDVIRSFARRAFRRPVPEAALEPFHRLASSDGLAMALKAMLCSPHFLYLHENAGVLDDHALASRLSYALTGSMPDAELLDLATRRTLTEPTTYDQQVERLLASAGSAEFAESFVSQWLHLRNIDKMPPDEKKYPDFYRISHGYTGTRDAIVQEPLLYFQHLLAHNLPISLLIDSDFTIMNDSLADFYGVAGVGSSGFRRVELDPALKRGGLLGMAAVLAASANGVDTSPVVRGIFVLDHLLGMPPKPPPEGIPALPADLRGTSTVRTMLDRHRADPSCNRCHQHIDPIGFALENFDAAGRWRTRYANAPIDASGSLPKGKPFHDIVGFKQELKNQVDLVAENLVRKLLVFSTGRKMGPMDDEEIAGLVERLEAGGYRLRDMVKAVCHSRIFTCK